MRTSKRPWLDKDGKAKRIEEIKKICSTWSADTWEAYLSTIEVPLREQLVPLDDLAKMPHSESYGQLYKDLIRQDDHLKLERLMSLSARVLSPTEREVLHLLYWEKKSLQETAIHFGVIKSTVVSYRDRALKKICKRMIEKEF